MNQAMWRDPATRRNATILAEDGRRIIGPEVGDQACGDTGPGRMAEPEALLLAVQQTLAAPCLRGRKVLVTAGPTQEALDPVRYLSNQSSGKQGYAIAQAAAAAGAQTILVSGPSNLPAPANVERIEVVSAQGHARRRAGPRRGAGASGRRGRRGGLSAQRPKPAKTEEAQRGTAQALLGGESGHHRRSGRLAPSPVVVGFAAERKTPWSTPAASAGTKTLTPSSSTMCPTKRLASTATTTPPP